MHGFLQLSSHNAAVVNTDLLRRLREYVPAHINIVLGVSKGESKAYPEELKPAIENLALICRLAYPDGRYRQNWTEKLPPEKKKLAVLHRAKGAASTAEKMLRSVGSYNKSQLAILLERDIQDIPLKKKPDCITTLQNLEELLPDSGYEVKCSIEQIKTISRDYLYIKALRNMVNHANESRTTAQNRLMCYLEDYGYQPLEQITINEMRRVILQALDHLQTRRGKE